MKIKPANSKWTDNQFKAITEEGQNILVSAGAGSGKTAVLTERIVEKIKDGGSIRRLLVVTFTEASAKEMKQRIKNAITKEVENNRIGKEELSYIDGALIMTFDAFSMMVVKKYHYLLNVSSSINIADNAMLEIQKKKIMNSVFERAYEDLNFQKFANDFFTKKDDLFKEYLLKCYQKIQLLIDKENFFNNYFDIYLSKEKMDNAVNDYLNIINENIEEIKYLTDELQKIALNSDFTAHAEDIYNAVFPLFDSKTYLERVRIASNILIPRTPKGCDFDALKDTKEQIKKKLNELLDLLRYDDVESLYKEIIATKENTKVILNLLKEFDLEITNFKREKNMYEFSDIALMAIKLFEDNQSLRKTFSEGIDEILIDEYQDTSDIQEYLMNLISRNNLYMVGDIKQSIYRFRNANPNIFKEKYLKYGNNDGGIKIDLYDNFRSRSEVLSGLNLIFSQLMDLKMGGVDYNKGHRLQFGLKAYDSNIAHNNDIEIWRYENKDVSTEAFLIASSIKEKIDSGYMVYNRDEKKLVKASYSDFSVLTQNKKNYDIYIETFERFGIPIQASRKEPFIESDEIYVVNHIFRLIYSLMNEEYYETYFKFSLAGLLRSFLFEVDDDSIRELFDGDLLSLFKEKYSEIYNNLVEIKNIASTSPINVILGLVYSKFQIFNRLSRIGLLEERKNKLLYLMDKANDLALLGYGIYDFINYFDEITKEGIDIEYDTEESKADAVNLMTIHKSKGLEFSICYFPELTSKFNLEDLNGLISFDLKLGFIMPYFYPKRGIKQTFYKDLQKSDYLKEEVSEKIRLFYVALTRAKEKAIFILPNTDKSFYRDTIPYVEKKKYRSFLDMMNSLSHMEKFVKKVTLDTSSNTNDESKMNVNLGKWEHDMIDVCLNRNDLQNIKGSIYEAKLQTKDEQKIIEEGNFYHKAFEMIDFNNPNLNGLPTKVRSKVEKFLAKPIFEDPIINFYTEYPFSYKMDGLVINGVIDLILEKENELIIVDYKLSNLSPDYKNQLYTYRNYLKQISEKSVKMYLYSIFKDELLEVE